MAAFVAFGTTVYKYAGGAIGKSLDERQEVRTPPCRARSLIRGQLGHMVLTPSSWTPILSLSSQAIISEINRLEELELKLYKETIDAAELEKTIVVRARTD